MYADLPDRLKQMVKEHLLADDFKAAKQIHDHWMSNRQCSHHYSQEWQYTRSEVC